MNIILDRDLVEESVVALFNHRLTEEVASDVLNGRKIDVFFSDGAPDNFAYRTALFCVKGTPNIAYGSINVNGSYLDIRSHWGRHYYNGEKIFTQKDTDLFKWKGRKI